MAMTVYQKAIKKLVGIQPPDPMGNASGTGVKPAANTTGAATGESVKPSAGAAGGASPSILPGAPGQGTVSNPVGVPGQATKQTLPQTNTIYKQAMDAAAPANQQYTSFYKPGEGFGAMGANDQAIWNGIGQKYAAGDQSYLTDTNQFRDSGNWGSYTDSNGNINGWLQVLNGTGGFAPVFGGKVGETGHDPGTVFAGPDGTAYIAGADGILKPAGTVNYATYGKAPGPGDGSLHGTFRASDGKTYNYDELSPEMAAQFGLVNSPGGGAHIGSVPEMTDQALAQGATTPEIAALVREDARMEEQGLPTPGTTVSGSSSGSSGSSSSGSGNVPADTTPTGTTENGETSPYKAALDEYDYGKAPEWEGSPYMADRDALLEQAKNLEWNYDPNTDPVWQAYQKQYRREGQRAIQDTLGRYSQLTGGLPSSYATSAAAQAGNYYAAQLSDRLPQLYQDAYQRYLDEYKRLMGLSDQYAAYDQTEYNRFYDDLGQWNKDREFKYGQERDARADYVDDRNFNEDVRQFDMNYDLKTRAQDFDEWYKKQGLTLEEAKMAFDQWYKQQGLSMDQANTIWDQWYKEQVLGQNQQELDMKKDDTDYNRNIYAEEIGNANFDNALAYLHKYGYVTGHHAEALGVPNGTTLEGYYRMNGIPLPEEEPVSGGGTTPPGGATPPSETPYKDLITDVPRTESGHVDVSGDGLNETPISGNGHYVVHEDGSPMSKGFQLWWPQLRNDFDNGMSKEELGKKILRLVDQGVLTDDDVNAIMDKLGLDDTTRNKDFDPVYGPFLDWKDRDQPWRHGSSSGR